MGSTRFPGKSMELLQGNPLIFWSLRNALRVPKIDKVLLATTLLPEDNVLVEYAAGIGVDAHRGHETNVLSRFVEVSQLFGAVNLIRITADNPLTPLDLATETLAAHLKSLPDYTSTSLSGGFPLGTDIECFSSSALERLSSENLSEEELEHVTLGFKTRPDKFSLLSPIGSKSTSRIRLTVDTPDDLDHMRALFACASPGWDLSLSEVIATHNRVFQDYGNLASSPPSV